MSLASLSALFPWPAEPPAVPADPHGWCCAGHREILQDRLGPDTQVVVELGSWLGQSARLLLELAPKATVICVDHWKGSSEMGNMMQAQTRLPTLELTWLVNQWPWKDRAIPVKADTLEGLRLVHEHGIRPDLVFVDAEHTYEAVSAELHLIEQLFPQALVHGDDWYLPDVKLAVSTAAARRHLTIRTVENAWSLYP